MIGALLIVEADVEDSRPTDGTWWSGPAITELSAHESIGDFDGDGVSDAQEHVLQLVPYDADSDGDGYEDGEELARQSDPLDFLSTPTNDGISASLTARGEDGFLKLVLCIHEPAGSVNDAKVRIGAYRQGQVVSAPLARFISISETYESTGADGGRVTTVEVPIQPAFVHSGSPVTFFLAAGHQGLTTYDSAAKVDIESHEGVLLLRRPRAANASVLNQGGGAIRQPIAPDGGASIPIDWVAGAICYQRSTLVGSAGFVSTYQVIEADCLQGWDSYCSSDCQANVGQTYDTVDPTALIGG